jgi:hypothetical protein
MFDYHFCRWVFRCWKGELGYQSTPCEFIYVLINEDKRELLIPNRSLAQHCMLEYSSRLYSAHSSVGAILPKSENELRFTLCCTNGLVVAFYFSDWRRFLWDSTSTDRPSYYLFSMASSWPCSYLFGSFLTILAPATISTTITTVPAMRGHRAK